MRIVVNEVTPGQLYPYLVSSVAPRPICFASTVDRQGHPNLSPFSFFNVFGGNPPVLVFSPLRRFRNNSIKHTLENIREVGEVVVNVVNYQMVQQTSLASCEYPKGINEFVKAGLTAVASEFVKPFRVKESPVQMECKVEQILATGNGGGAGNLVICKVLCLHIDDSILNDKGAIDQNKIDLVARLGSDYYCRASGEALFRVPKPNTELGIGIDALPAPIRKSNVLTGNQLGILGNYRSIPSLDTDFRDELMEQLLLAAPQPLSTALQTYAAALIDAGETDKAWQVLLRMD